MEHSSDKLSSQH